jgi:putative hydrolase of the HAD superfamily
MRPSVHIRAVLFDFHDTLFQVEPTRAWIESAARATGYDTAWPALESLAANMERVRTTPEVRALLDGGDRSREAHRRATLGWLRIAGVPAPLAEAMYGRMTDPAGWRPYPDAAPTLRALKAGGIKIGVVSNTGWDLRPTFHRYRLASYIDAFMLSCDEGFEKPDPALFQRGCAALGSRPQHTLMVGDNPQTDGGAVNAGLAAYLLAAPTRHGPRGLTAVQRLVLKG